MIVHNYIAKLVGNTELGRGESRPDMKTNGTDPETAIPNDAGKTKCTLI